MNPPHITQITVFGEGGTDGPFGARGRTLTDYVFNEAAIDGGERLELRVTVRQVEGHPILVYLGGGAPLYQTVVYRAGELIAVSTNHVVR